MLCARTLLSNVRGLLDSTGSNGEDLSAEPGHSSQQAALQGASSGKRGKGGKAGAEAAGRRRSSKKDELRSKNREAQRRFREKQKCALAPACACIAGGPHKRLLL